MENISAKEFLEQKFMCQSIVEELNLVLQKLYKKTLKIAETYSELSSEIVSAKDFSHAAKCSKGLDELRPELIKNLTLCDRLNSLISRNNDRIKFIDKQLKDAKNEELTANKKSIMSLFEKEKITLSDDKINIDLNGTKKIRLFYNDLIFNLVDGKITLADKRNYVLMQNLDEKPFREISNKFPYMLFTISDEQLLNTKFKQKVLKQIASICDEKLHTNSIKEINEMFGSPLILDSKVPSGMREYVDEVVNLFNVRTKYYLIETYPYLAEQVNLKLVCDESSVNLPKKLLRKKLSGGAKDNKTESKLSQDAVGETQKASGEDKSVDELNSFLNDLLDDNDDRKA